MLALAVERLIGSSHSGNNTSVNSNSVISSGHGHNHHQLQHSHFNHHVALQNHLHQQQQQRDFHRLKFNSKDSHHSLGDSRKRVNSAGETCLKPKQQQRNSATFSSPPTPASDLSKSQLTASINNNNNYADTNLLISPKTADKYKPRPRNCTEGERLSSSSESNVLEAEDADACASEEDDDVDVEIDEDQQDANKSTDADCTVPVHKEKDMETDSKKMSAEVGIGIGTSVHRNSDEDEQQQDEEIKVEEEDSELLSAQKSPRIIDNDSCCCGSTTISDDVNKSQQTHNQNHNNNSHHTGNNGMMMMRLMMETTTTGNSICDNKGVVVLGPPSRPPSTASEISATSCSNSTTCSSSNSYFSNNNVSLSTSLMMITQPQQHNSLKFSIDDILRPEFGQKAIEKTQSPSIRRNVNTASVKRTSSILHNKVKQRNTSTTVANNIKNPHGTSSGVSSSGTEATAHRQLSSGRPSSVKDHSEDSNSSCNSSSVITTSTTTTSSSTRGSNSKDLVDESKVNPTVPKGPLLWPAWVYCTRYSDRPSSGPRSKRMKRPSETGGGTSIAGSEEEKRPRTAFTGEQLGRLKHEFDENRYLTEKRRQDLARELKLHENQIKIWFQNKRAKLKKSNGQRGGLALQLMAQGLYNHSTIPMDEDEEDYLPCP